MGSVAPTPDFATSSRPDSVRMNVPPLTKAVLFVGLPYRFDTGLTKAVCALAEHKLAE